MNPNFSPNTQAILLLTAPLIAGRSEPSPDLLTPGEYKRLARHLHQLSQEPADLLSAQSDEILREAQTVIDATRLKRLLARGFALSQAVERWQSRAIWVVSRADAEYPQRLRERLKEDRPAVLYGCGERSILDSGGLAVVGSRNVDESLIEYTQSIGRLAAKARKTLVSGGARGIDQAAMRGALESGGKVSGVMADSLEKTTMTREHRNLLIEGQLVLISPYDPSAGFNVGNAMQRNKLIYALADAALVVNSDYAKGGTWTGAVEQLDKLRFVPVFVRSDDSTNKAFSALRQKGALPWPNPEDADGLIDVLNGLHVPQKADTPPSQLTLSEAILPTIAETVDPASAPTPPEKHAPTEPSPPSVQKYPESTSILESNELVIADAPATNPADILFDAAKRCIIQVLVAPMKVPEITDSLGVTQAQVKEWLQRLVDDGIVEKTKGSLFQLRKADLFAPFLSSNSANSPDQKT